MISSRWVVTFLLIAGCDAAEGVRVQPLPPLERPSPEARAGLPEIAGDWRFTGWELAAGDSAGLGESYPELGNIAVQVQRLDSVAGAYNFAGGSLPLYGEVRRDSVVSMVAVDGSEGRFIAGQVESDTLWIHLTTLLEPDGWPAGARAGFVRMEPAITFVRLPGQTVTLALADTAVADTAAAAADTLAAPAQAGSEAPLLGFGGFPTPSLAAADTTAAPPSPAGPAGPLLGFGGFPTGTARAEAATEERPSRPRLLGTPTQAEPERAPAPAAESPEREPAQTQPAPAEPEQPPQEPEPEPDVAPGPRLLGVPVDTTAARR